MFKKLILIFSLIVFCFNITVSADDTVSLSVPKEFYVYSENPEKLSEILGMTVDELNSYCESNSIFYLAANGDNSKQIRVATGENDFSNGVVNLSNLTDDKIISLAPDIAGIEGIRGDVVSLSGQKFLKLEMKSTDSGGDYILTQYITVAHRQNIVLSFYSGDDTDYIDLVFESFTSDLFITEKTDNNSLLSIVIPVATVAFLIICVGLALSIIIELKIQKSKAQNDETEE